MKKRLSLFAVLAASLIFAGYTFNGAVTVPAGSLLTAQLQRFSGATGVNFLRVPDNVAVALTVEDYENGGDLLTLATTNSSEQINAAVPVACASSLSVTGALAVTGQATFNNYTSQTFGTATAGLTQTQAGATALSKTFNKVTTGNANDGVALPSGSTSMCVMVSNISANALKVYGNNADDDTIDGGSADASVTQAASAKSVWYCTTNGVAWTSFQ
jgi:hypothetical protein